MLFPLKMAEESDVQPVNKTYNTIEPKVCLVFKSKGDTFLLLEGRNQKSAKESSALF